MPPRKRGGKAERVMNTSFIFCLEFTFFWPKNSRHNNATVRLSPLVIMLSRQHNSKYNVSQQDAWSPMHLGRTKFGRTQLWKDPLLSGPAIFSWFNSVSGKAYRPPKMSAKLSRRVENCPLPMTAVIRGPLCVFKRCQMNM